MNTNETNMKEQNLEALKKYATNLIEQARAGRLDPVVGRDEEIRRVLQILYIGIISLFLQSTLSSQSSNTECQKPYHR